MKTRALVAILAVGYALGARADVEIALRLRVEAGSNVLRVGDVAVLRSSDLALLRAIVDLPILRAPLPGERVVIGQSAVAGWIRARTGLDPSALQWSGPERTEVATGLQLVRGEDIAAAAEAALRGWLQPHFPAQVEVQGLPRDVSAPPGPMRLVARPLDGTALRSRMLVWVEVWVAQRFVRLAAVPFHVAAWREVAVAGRPLAASRVLEREDVAHAQADVAAHPQAFVEVGAEHEQQIRRPVTTGAVLRRSDLEHLPAVQRGQWASLRSGEGAVVTQARVEVLQDGRVGQNVRVRASGAPTALFARVTGPGQLEVAR